jgi:hypothetical protein
VPLRPGLASGKLRSTRLLEESQESTGKSPGGIKINEPKLQDSSIGSPKRDPDPSIKKVYPS